jgi:hypothetical protein
MIAKIDKLFTWLVPDLPIGVLGKANVAGRRDPSSRAAILTPSPIKSPSDSSITSLR